ncbi:MAG: transcriptional regulator, LysR family protein [Pseudonocardiales bacterium]|nr:transcriptional regulator, LysR family protein [Pseudonocardiales bacterium]
MELRQLEYFVAVAEEANFTRAAERVHISQSGVSAQIRQLERELGAALIDRSARTATLTSAGLAALVHARAVLAGVETIRQSVDEVTGLIRGRLTVGMVTACTVEPLFDGLAAFHRAHPRIELQLTEANSDALVDAVRAGSVDLALVGTASQPPSDLAAISIVSEGLVAVVPDGHPLAKRVRVTLGALSEFPIICLPRGTGVRAVFDQACAAAGLNPDITLQATAPDAVVDLASRGLGVAVLSKSMATGFRARLKVVGISDIDIAAVLALVWRPGPSPALDELLVHCRRAFGRKPTAVGPTNLAKAGSHPQRRGASGVGKRIT